MWHEEVREGIEDDVQASSRDVSMDSYTKEPIWVKEETLVFDVLSLRHPWHISRR